MKSSKIRILSIIMCVVCLVPLFACNKDKKNSNKKDDKKSKVSREVRLPYSQEDTLNPYLSKSLINKSLMTLIYDSLYTLDESYKAKESIASTGVIAENTVTVRLNTNKKFADGSYINANDVVDSFNLAKLSALYSSSLVNFEKAEAKSSSEVEFTMIQLDKFALNQLTFPIVKSGKVADLANAFPINSGKYKVVYEDNNRWLKVNSNFSGFDTKNKKIKLVNITDSTAINYSLALGNIDCMFTDLSKGKYERINASTEKVIMNNLVFLGVNPNSTKLSDVKLRQSISTILNRDKIVNEGFQGYASSAYTVFNPKFYELKNVKQPGKATKKENAIKYIQEKYRNLSLKIVVNAENPFKVSTGKTIQSLLSNAGVNVTLQELSFEQYNNSINSGWYDLYLGEMKLNNDMSLYYLLKPSTPSFDSYIAYQNGSIKTQEFLNQYYSQMPLIPLCYRNGVVAFSRDINVEVKSEENNIYKNIKDWQIKK